MHAVNAGKVDEPHFVRMTQFDAKCLIAPGGASLSHQWYLYSKKVVH